MMSESQIIFLFHHKKNTELKIFTDNKNVFALLMWESRLKYRKIYK